MDMDSGRSLTGLPVAFREEEAVSALELRKYLIDGSVDCYGSKSRDKCR